MSAVKRDGGKAGGAAQWSLLCRVAWFPRPCPMVPMCGLAESDLGGYEAAQPPANWRSLVVLLPSRR